MGEKSGVRKAERARGFGYGSGFSSSEPESESPNCKLVSIRLHEAYRPTCIETTHSGNAELCCLIGDYSV